MTNKDPEESTMHGASRTHLAEQLSRRVLTVNLDAEMAELWKGIQPEGSGRAAKTLVKHPDLRVTLIAIRGGIQITEHEVSGRVSIQCLKGKVTLHVQDKALDLSAGQILALDRDMRHDVAAAEDSVLLVTVAQIVREE